MMENKEIKEAVEELEVMSRSEKLRRKADLRLKAIRDEKAAMSLATKRGIEQGLELGKIEGEHNSKIEIAINMLKKNMRLEDIVEVTGLSIEEIEKLKEDKK